MKAAGTSPEPSDHEERAVERTTWMTDERFGVSVAGAPSLGRGGVVATGIGLEIPKQSGFVPAVHGSGPVTGSNTVAFHSNDHIAKRRTAWLGTPLGSRGAGNG